MTKLEAVIERLKALPEAEKEAMAAQIDRLLSTEALLSLAQWAEVERRLNDETEESIPHEEVVSYMRTRFGG